MNDHELLTGKLINDVMHVEWYSTPLLFLMHEDTAVLCPLLHIIYYCWLVIEIHGKESVMNQYRLVSATEKTISNGREEFVSSRQVYGC